MKMIITLLLFAVSHVALAAPKKIFILGDSITEGYGVATQKAYPAILKEKLKKKYSNLEFIPSAISGSITASAPSRLEWLVKTEKASMQGIIVVLGGNDLLRGIKPLITQKNLERLIEIAAREKLPVLIAEMPTPANYPDYKKQYEKMYQKLAVNDVVTLLPGFLQGVLGVAAVNQSDGIHPNELGHALIAKNITPGIEKWIKKIGEK